MKLNSVFLTSAATLMATSVAFAADLPSKKAAPSAGSVQVCKVAGKTGFTLPGSDTCVVLSGYVWAEVNATGSGNGFFDTTDKLSNYSTKLREQLNVDALSNTEMGVLASHASFRFNQYGASDGAYGNNGSSSGAAIDSAYIQLGGFKVGYFDSTFGMMDGSPSYEAPNNTPSNTVMQIGYSAKLSSGVTLGLALEDVVGYSNFNGSRDTGDAKMPDVVGTIDFSTAMADIHLGVVYHDVAHSENAKMDSTGYAFDAGATFKLDSLAKGDTLAIEYTYTDGAGARSAGHLSYPGGPVYGYNIATYDNAGWSTYDGENTTGYNIGAAFKHVLSSSLSMNVFGAYGSYDASLGEFAPVAVTLDATYFGANLDYQPIKGFHIQPEVWHLSQTASYDAGPTDNSSYTGAVLRIKRDF